MAPINIVLNGDPDSCDAAAEAMGKLGSGAGGNADAVHKAKNSSEACWQGRAGSAFRAHTNRLGTDADDVSSHAKEVQKATRAFADDLRTVKSRLNQARLVTSEAGLATTEASIEDPGPAPKAPGPMGMQDRMNLYIQKGQHAAKVKAFNEARETVADARKIEQAAHQRLNQSVKDVPSTLDTIRTVAQGATGNALTATKELHTNAKSLFNDAEKLEASSKRMAELATDEKLSNAGRAAAGRLARSQSKGAKAARKQGNRWEKPVRRIPSKVRDAISANPGQLLEDSTGILKVGSKVLKGVPGASALVTAASSGVEVAEGKKSVAKAGAETGFSLGGAAVAGLGGSEVAGTACSIFPPAAPVCATVDGIGGGIIGGLAGKKGADQLFGGG